MSRVDMFLLAALIFAVGAIIFNIDPFVVLVVIGSAGFAIGSAIVVGESKGRRKWDN